MLKKCLGAIFISSVVLLSGCSEKEYTSEDFIDILEKDKDFQEYQTDFTSFSGNDFNLTLKDSYRLDGEKIDQRISKDHDHRYDGLEKIYSDLPEHELYEVWMYDHEHENYGLVAILDMDEKKVVEMVARVTIIAGIEDE